LRSDIRSARHRHAGKEAIIACDERVFHSEMRRSAALQRGTPAGAELLSLVDKIAPHGAAIHAGQVID
jgi:hypothetical protein